MKSAVAPLGDMRIPDAAFRGHRNQYFVASAKRMSALAFVSAVLAHATVAAVFLHASYPLWRALGAALLTVAFLVFQISLVRRVKGPDDVEITFRRLSLAAQFSVATTVIVTGGMHSPLAPSLVLPGIVAVMFFGPHELSYKRVVLNFAVIVLVSLLPEAITGPQLDRFHFTVATVTILLLAMHTVFMIMKRVTAASQLASCAVFSAREAQVSETEAQTRRLQSVGAKVAHELKNPLAAIKGLVQLVARAPNHDRTGERLAVVEAEIVRMETILREYLSFARPLQELVHTAVDAAVLVNEVIDVLAGRAATTGIALVQLGGAAPLAADARRLREALLNLVGNALDATAAGGTVSIATHRRGDHVHIKIVDTGRGIAPEDLARLGTSFFTTRVDGTGLGVVLAASAIAQHGGTLRYDSTPGQGTTAHIELPCTAQPTSEAAPTGTPAVFDRTPTADRKGCCFAPARRLPKAHAPIAAVPGEASPLPQERNDSAALPAHGDAADANATRAIVSSVVPGAFALLCRVSERLV